MEAPVRKLMHRLFQVNIFALLALSPNFVTASSGNSTNFLVIELITSLAITWAIGIIFPLLIRFVFVRNPLSRKAATWIAAINSVLLWISFRMLNIAIENPDASKGLVWIIVFFVARWIMSRGYRLSSESAAEVAEDNPTRFNGQSETDTKAGQLDSTAPSDKAYASEIPLSPPASKIQKHQVLLVLWLASSLVISSIPFVYDWNRYSTTYSQIEDVSKYPQMSDRDKSNRALDDFLSCLKEVKDETESNCFSWYTRAGGPHYGDTIYDNYYLMKGMEKDSILNGRLVEDLQSRYNSLSKECFNVNGKRIDTSKMIKEHKTFCYNEIPRYFKLIEKEYSFAGFWQRQGGEMVLFVPVTFSALIYLFFSIGYIPNFPHKGWKRLSLVTAGICSISATAYGLSSYNGIFGIDGWPLVFIGLGLYPAFFWFMCGAISLKAWVKEGFAS
jgi:hypothetical protein